MSGRKRIMPDTNGSSSPAKAQHGERTCILYARASLTDQEFSIPGQLRELTAHAENAGLRVVAEVEDRGEKRHTLERPGIHRIRELCEHEKIDEVWAWSWDRYGEFPIPEVLALELEEFGTKLRSLDDNGGGESSYEMTAIKSLFSRREQRDREKRARRGRTDKALRGQMFGGGRARYGFRFVRGKNQRGREVNVGYEVDPAQMEYVRRMFEMVADGESVRTVTRELEKRGVLNPRGGASWSRTTIRDIVLDDAYLPRSYEEVASMVTPEVAAGMNPERVYGIHWHGRKRSKFKNSRSKHRVIVDAPREEWVGIPVDLTESGLDRATVERARARVEHNRLPAKAGDRFWPLSGGILRCGECGRAMIAYRRAKKTGFNYYYRCRPTHRDVCPNRKSHPAEEVEGSALEILRRTMSDKEAVLERFDAAVAPLRREAHSERVVESLTEELVNLERKREGYWDLAASGDISKDVMRTKVAQVEERIAAIKEELASARDATAWEAQIELARWALIRFLDAGGDADWLRTPLQKLGVDASWTPQALRENLQKIGVRLFVDRNGYVTELWEIEPPLHSGITYR